MSVTQSIRRHNVRGEPIAAHFDKIAIERESDAGRWTEYRDIGISGGMVGGVPDGVGVTTHYEVRWDQQTLVMENSSRKRQPGKADEWKERREIWSLDGKDLLRVTVTVASSGQASRTVTAVYRRK